MADPDDPRNLKLIEQPIPFLFANNGRDSHVFTFKRRFVRKIYVNLAITFIKGLLAKTFFNVVNIVEFKENTNYNGRTRKGHWTNIALSNTDEVTGKISNYVDADIIQVIPVRFKNDIAFFCYFCFK